MRSSIPALFFLAILVAQSLYDSLNRWRLHIAIISVVLIASLNPIHQMVFHISKIIERESITHFRLSDQRTDIVVGYTGQNELLRQYVSSIDTLFFQTLARPIELVSEYLQNEKSFWLSGNALLFENPQVTERQVYPGTQTTLSIPFRVINKIDTNYSLATRVVGLNDMILWYDESWPTNRATSSLPPSNQLWYDQRTITIPNDAPEGIYRIELYLADSITQEKVSLYKLWDTDSRKDLISFDYLVVGTPNTANLRPVLDAAFGEELALIGTNMPKKVVKKVTEIIAVHAVWKTLSQPSTDYTSFVHLIDTNGQLIAQHDQPPLDGHLPTSLWQPGLIVPDNFKIVLPNHIKPGIYTLYVGFYNPHTGNRLSLAMSHNSAYNLGQVQIVK